MRLLLLGLVLALCGSVYGESEYERALWNEFGDRLAYPPVSVPGQWSGSRYTTFESPGGSGASAFTVYGGGSAYTTYSDGGSAFTVYGNGYNYTIYYP